MSRRGVSLLLACAPLLCPAALRAQAVKDLDPHVRVTAAVAPPRLSLSWDAMPETKGFTVLRREGGSRGRRVIGSHPGSVWARAARDGWRTATEKCWQEPSPPARVCANAQAPSTPEASAQ